jgi:cysteinyl-tRNA synthetase
MEYFYETLQRVDERLGGHEVKPGPLHGDPDVHLRVFEQAMDDDFNTAGALAALSGLFAQLNEYLDKPPVPDRAMVVRTLATLRAVVPTMGGVLGILESSPLAWLERRRDRLVAQRKLDRELVERLIAERSEARKQKDFARSDAMRNRLLEMGVELRDGAGGTQWKVRS